MNNENNNLGNQIPNNNQNINTVNNNGFNPATQQFQQPINNMNQINTNSNAKNGMNKNAITSCIFSVVAIFIFGWLAYAGLGLGISAVAEIKKNKQKGIVFAIIGIVVGFVGTVLNIYRMMMR